MQKLNSRKATGPSEVSVKRIVARSKIGVKVAMDLCQRVLNGKGMPIEWKISIIVPMSKRKGNVMSCVSYRSVKLLKPNVKIVEMVLKRSVRTLIILNKAQFGFYARKTSNGFNIDCEENARGISKERQEVVHVFC